MDSHQNKKKLSRNDKILVIGAFVIALGLIGLAAFKSNLIGIQAGKIVINPQENISVADATKTASPLYDEVVAKVTPKDGFHSKIVLTDAIVKLIKNGVIDKDKFEALYKNRGGLPPGLKDVLTQPSSNPIVLTQSNASYYINLLWPLGLSNYMLSNEKSPINGKDLYNFASTGGWNLGKKKNGGAYFNKFNIVKLTSEQEALAMKVASGSYRPCCGNSAFFQDCNHGSALLGMLELGASQGISEDQLWKEAVAFNSFWFPQTYITTALYFKAVKNTDWENVDPKLIMSKEFSSATGSIAIGDQVAKIPNLLPAQGIGGGGSCGT